MMNHVLIDYENVQAADLAFLRGGSFKVKIFLGPHQSKVPIGLVTELQALGRDAEYIVLKTTGKNALDFHGAERPEAGAVESKHGKNYHCFGAA
jgi:hypothetical protein